MKTKFNADVRLKAVIVYLEISQKEFAEQFGLDPAAVSRWIRMEGFSPTVYSQLVDLEKKGINLDYFKLDSEPMLIKNKIYQIEAANQRIKELTAENKKLRNELENLKNK